MRTYSVTISAKESADIYDDARKFADVAKGPIRAIEEYMKTGRRAPTSEDMHHVLGLLRASKNMMEHVAKLMAGVRKLQGRPSPERRVGAHKIEV